MNERIRYQSGASIVEILIFVVIASVMIASLYGMLITHTHSYQKDREREDVHATLRAATALVTHDLRQVSAEDGDIYSIGDHSIVIRSLYASGVICAEHHNETRYALWGISGEFEATAVDSALILATNETGFSDDVWKPVKLVQVWDTPPDQLVTCFWGDTTMAAGTGSDTISGPTTWTGTIPSELAVEVAIEAPGDLDGVYIGAPLRAFRKVEYGVFEQDGRHWFGRRVGDASDWETLTGPLPSATALAFNYFDATGSATTAAADVHRIDVMLSAKSFGHSINQDGQVFQEDSLSTTVYVRG